MGQLQRDFFGLGEDPFICFAYIHPHNSTYTQDLEYEIFDRTELGCSTHISNMVK